MSVLSELVKVVWRDRHKQPTGSDAQRALAQVRAGLVARYKLKAVPGRPEELELTVTGARVSLAYASKSMRVRLQQGRMWLDRRDFPLPTDEHGVSQLKASVFAYTDPHFGWVRNVKAPKLDVFPQH